MKIVKYDDSYAKGVAKMWNLSHDSWGGGETLKTEESVIQEEATKGYINLYLAVDGEEVVGYCGFSIYEGDKDTSYLPLLNVRPDYHGKRVGKMLVLKVIEDAIKSEYNRFDLYTWDGNIKAMPLYKKCGFMWEKKIGAVHLMNWLPYMFKTDAIKDYFNRLDWYKDNKRLIDMNYDGDEVDEMTTFTYHFENDEDLLIVKFERSGRGIKSIETHDYKIEIETPAHKLIYGNDYQLNYIVENKSGKKLEIEVEGLNDESIVHEFKHNVIVDSKSEFTSEFTVNKPILKFDDFATAPVVASKIKINGKEAIFKIGVNSVAAVEFKLHTLNKLHHTKNDYFAYLDVESNLETDERVKVEFTKGIVEFEDFEIDLKKHEKRSVKLPYKVNEYGVYSQDVEYTVQGKNYSYRIENPFFGESGVFYHEIEGNHYLGNNEYYVAVDQKYSDISLYTSQGYASAEIMTPNLGEPFTKEFTNATPDKVEHFVEGTTAHLNLTYHSKDFVGVSVVSKIKLHAKGVLEHNFDIINVNYPKNSINVLASYYLQTSEAYIPYNGKIYDFGKEGIFGMAVLESKKLDENWVYFKKESSNTGITFDFDGVEILEYKVGKNFLIENFKKGSTHSIARTFLSSTNLDVHKFREFSINEQNARKRSFSKQFDIEINGGNPIVRDNLKIGLTNNISTDDQGTITFEKNVKSVDSINNFEKLFKIEEASLIKEVVYESKKLHYTKKVAIFNQKGQVKTITSSINNMEVMTVDNGIIQFSASKDYFDSIFSLKWNSKEILNSTFPELNAKSWWNLWPGGIHLSQHPINNGLRKDGIIKVEEAILEDNFKNKWNGLKLSSKITKEKLYSPTTLETYVLTLPGVDLVCVFTTQSQESGKYQENHHHNVYFEWNREQEIKMFTDDNSYIKTLEYCYGKYGKDLTYQVGETFITLVSESKLSNFDESEISGANFWEMPSIPDRDCKVTKPTFMVIGDSKLDPKMLMDLKNIKFEVK